MVRFIEMGSRTVVVRGWGKGQGELLFHGCRVSVWKDEKILETGGGDTA